MSLTRRACNATQIQEKEQLFVDFDSHLCARASNRGEACAKTCLGADYFRRSELNHFRGYTDIKYILLAARGRK